MILLTVFLGNPGKQYEQSRHNAAWLFAKNLTFYNDLNWQKGFKGKFAVLEAQKLYAHTTSILKNPSPAQKYYFLQPETYMNLSGESIIELAHFYKIKPEEILVVHDELELPQGMVSLKWAGGLGGHNGLRSTKEVFGTPDFWRLRIGIGRPNQIKAPNQDISSWVLSNFSADEHIILSQVFSQLNDALVQILLTDPKFFLKDWAKKKLSAD